MFKLNREQGMKERESSPPSLADGEKTCKLAPMTFLQGDEQTSWWCCAAMLKPALLEPCALVHEVDRRTDK